VIFDDDPGAGGGRPVYPPAVEQALVAVASRPRLRRTLFGSIGALHRGASGLRRLTGRRG
jgi:hypothetical protein